MRSIAAGVFFAIGRQCNLLMARLWFSTAAAAQERWIADLTGSFCFRSFGGVGVRPYAFSYNSLTWPARNSPILSGINRL